MATVEINDAFWNARIQATREGTLPAIHNQLKETGRWDAFKLTWKPGEPNQPHYFWDSDVAKFVEGAMPWGIWTLLALSTPRTRGGRRRQSR